jgi:hypothetical protein
VKDLIAIQQKRGNVIIRNDQLDMQDEEQDEESIRSASLGLRAIAWGIILVI